MAATLYYFADEGRMQKVANSFGIGKSTVFKIIRRVTQAISKYLGGKYVMRSAIWYHLYNFKKVKNTHGGVLILVKLQA